MTDKAAREALELRTYREGEPHLTDAEMEPFVDLLDKDIECGLQATYRAGHQAAHDAAMAAEPDVRLVVCALKALDDPRVPSPTVGREAVRVLESIALQLQAAHQREAECRKALAELVMLKDLKIRAGAMNSYARGAPGKVRAGMLREYELRKGPAWEAARAALATQPKGET